MEAKYRIDYVGEFVILETKWSGGKKEQVREWVANPIENQHISHRAACIGSNIDRDRFDYTRLQRHRGGLLGSKKLQTYGSGTIAQDMRLDFAVETNAGTLQTLIDTDYATDNIVYTSSRNCISNPGLFYLTPYNPHLSIIAQIPYLAAFDGHHEIFLLGYTIDSMNQNLRQIMDIEQIFKSYKEVTFYLVGEPTNMPTQWLEHNNIQTMSYRDFVGYCDV